MAERVHDHVAMYIEASARTTTRSREILILIIIVSVLIFGAFWNSRQTSWISARIERLTDSHDLLKMRVAADALPASPQKAVIETTMREPRYVQAAEYLKLRHSSLPDLPTIDDTRRKLEEIETEHVLYLKLPFFGLFMDLNDLGMLGGFTFMVLLLWFRSSLWHELQNLEITFREAQNHRERRFCYEALSMQQVLTIPPPIDTGKRVGHWGIIVKVLLALPFVVHGLVVAYDWESFSYGWTVSPPNTIIGTVTSAVFLFIIAWLTVLCFNLVADIGRKWSQTAEVIRNSAPEETVRPEGARVGDRSPSGGSF